MADEETHHTLEGIGIFQRLNPFKSLKKPIVPLHRQICPEHTAGFFSLLTFSWLSPIMSVSLHVVLALERY
jgi:hypothetical protein